MCSAQIFLVLKNFFVSKKFEVQFYMCCDQGCLIYKITSNDKSILQQIV